MWKHICLHFMSRPSALHELFFIRDGWVVVCVEMRKRGSAGLVMALVNLSHERELN